MCACVETVGTAIGAVCVEYGRPKWPITMLNHTHIHCTEECFVFYFWHPMLVRPVMKRLFFPGKTKETKARFARAPHDESERTGESIRQVSASRQTGAGAWSVFPTIIVLLRVPPNVPPA